MNESPSNSPLVSVCLITYNHASYIRQAIESVLMQKNISDWEIIIADDCSTDGTREIVNEFAQKFPRLIKPLLQNKNVGPAQNWLDLISAARGTFIAYLEGDDYWIDEWKLQKQISFLEENSDCVYCYTNAQIMRHGDLSQQEMFVKKETPKKHSFGFFLDHGLVAPSCTSVFLREAMPSPWPEWMKTVYSGDLAFQALIGLNGNFAFLNEMTAVYRVHAASKINSNKNAFALSENFLILMDRFSEMMGSKYQRKINFHRADHLEFMAFEKLKQHDWKNFFSLFAKSLRYDFFRGLPTLRRGFYRFRESLKSASHHQASLN